MKIKIMSSAEGYDLAAVDYDKKTKYLNSFENRKIISLLGDVKKKKILDIGAGTGRLSISLAQSGADLVATDISEKMLKELSKKNCRIVTDVADAEDLPYEDNTFDFVVAAFLIVHFKDTTRFFDEVYRVLKPDGKLLVTNINQKEPPEIKTNSGVIKIESYYHRPDKIIETLESLAFSIEKEEFIYQNDIWINQIILAKK